MGHGKAGIECIRALLPQIQQVKGIIQAFDYRHIFTVRFIQQQGRVIGDLQVIVI